MISAVPSFVSCPCKWLSLAILSLSFFSCCFAQTVALIQPALPKTYYREKWWQCCKRDFVFWCRKWACFRCKTEMICLAFGGFSEQTVRGWSYIGSPPLRMYTFHTQQCTPHPCSSSSICAFPLSLPSILSLSSQQAVCHLCRVGWMVAPPSPCTHLTPTALQIHHCSTHTTHVTPTSLNAYVLICSFLLSNP